MKNEYAIWIMRKVQSENPYGQCERWAKLMQEEFPELEIVRGYYICPVWGSREHWWVSDGNEIIDPTVSQFPTSDGIYMPSGII